MIGPAELWHGLGWPLIRLTGLVSLGLMIGNLIEALNWTRGVARLAAPLVRLGHLRDVSGASFSMAFFSGVTANTMLAEAHDQGRLSTRELIFSNLFNSLPTYFLHLPTTAFLVIPLIGPAALPYLCLTVGAALLRTLSILVVARLALPPLPEQCVQCELPDPQGMDLRRVASRTWDRFKRRIRKILAVTLPIYLIFFAANRLGFFAWVESLILSGDGWVSWLSPQALSIMAFSAAAESSAGMAAAGALLDAGTLPVKDVVLALILGNVLSSPMRVFRQQFPTYAGIFRPRLAVKLILASQTLRVTSLLVLVGGYYSLA